jgi:Domain of unknown function (DUF4173)
MTSLATPLPDNLSAVRPDRLAPKLVIAIALASLADFLFYDERMGLSLVVFTAAVIGGTLLANIGRVYQGRAWLAAIIIVAGLTPALEELNTISFILVVLALGVGVSVLTNPNFGRLTDQLRALRDLYLIGPFRFFRDTATLLNVSSFTAGLVVWLVPLAFGFIFILLFASANPLIEHWISLINVKRASSTINVGQSFFWLIMLLVTWPFIHIRWRQRKPPINPDAAAPVAVENEAVADVPNFFSEATILRSLILFNLLFAIQTVLDLVYLWGHAALPAGVTYAAYAHQGSYPLIVTALLAAGFVLEVIKAGEPTERSRLIRPLVYLWIAQNVMLVASSIQRLHLYVEIYMLTYWRVAAFIWMLLVAIGLVLIVARMVLERSNGWLVRMNLISLGITLYVCALVNFTAIIADYNVSHCKEASGQGVEIDVWYLVSLGPQALPAFDKAIALRKDDGTNLVYRRNLLVDIQRQDMASWRSWGFRSWRLQRYLDNRNKQSDAG